MTKILVLAQQEHNQKQEQAKLSHATRCAVSAALKISDNIDVLYVSDTDHCSQEIAALQGVKNVWVILQPQFAHPLAENVSSVIQHLASSKQYSHIFAAATTFGKNIIPRVAALCDVACLSDITAVISPDTVVRPIYAGNAFETVQALDKLIIVTIRPTAFEAVGLQSELAPIQLLKVSDTNICFDKTQFVSQDTPVQNRPDLGSAKIVISGGRAFKSAENFKMLEALADKLGAAIGATRAAVDAGFAPNDLQVGQTGKVVAPNLYMAFGISGAIQHIAGIKDSKVIVAINQDPDAPIFQVADYGLVGDIFTMLPELIEKISL